MRCFVLAALTVAACAPGNPRIGERAAAVDYGSLDSGDPAVVGIRYPGLNLHCSGSLVGQSTVLTAGHCVYNQPVTQFIIAFGSDVTQPTQTVGVTGYTLHPQYDLSAPVPHDIAVLSLAAPITNVPLVRLNRRDNSTFVNTNVRVVGFGVDETAGNDGVKRTGTALFKYAGDPNYMIANPSMFDSGDSGGPTFAMSDGIEVQTGVHSGSGINGSGVLNGSDTDVKSSLPEFLQSYFLNHDQSGIDYDCSNIVPNEGRCIGDVEYYCDVSGTGLPASIDCSNATSPQQCGLNPQLSWRGVPIYSCSCQNCNQIGKTCGTATDECGFQIQCGTCTSPATCGGGGIANVCGTPGDKACLGGVNPETAFSPGMAACGGSVTWDRRNALCGAGWSACSASQWVSFKGSATPINNYWTNDNLGWSGSGPNNCSATTSGVTSCGTNDPMRVCGANQDGHGNVCNWTGCGLNTTTNQYFGGCSGNYNAGTLCCMSNPAVACASGVAHAQSFAPGVVGCSGMVAWGLRNTLCGPHCAACTVAQYARYASAAPQYDYWLDDELHYGGSGPNNCYASSSGSWCGNNAPMRVCVPGTQVDPLGNHCNWYGCGYNTASPNLYLGGCVGNTTAGTLCCCDQ